MLLGHSYLDVEKIAVPKFISNNPMVLWIFFGGLAI
jgi:hypothetical protein